MKKIICLTILFVFIFVQSLLAFDWKDLHTQADSRILKDAQEIIMVNPDSVSDLYVLGLIYLNLRMNKEAESVFTKIVNLDKDLYEAKWGIAEVKRREHQLDKAEESLVEIKEAYPDFAPALISLAYIKYIKMDFNAAVKLASTVVYYGKDKVDLSNYVRALLLVGGSKGMIAHYGGPISKLINGMAVFPNLKRAEEFQPDSSQVLFGLGSFYLLAPSAAGGNIDFAFNYLEKAAKLDPGFSDCFVRLAQAYKIKGDMKKYEINIAKALELDPQNEIALDVKSGSCKFICLGK